MWSVRTEGAVKSHLELRRREEVVVWDFKGQEDNLHGDRKSNVCK